MEYVYLGDTSIKVSKLCFGSLTVSPLQANLSIEEGAEIIKYAYSRGINFIDTAELYSNYSYIKEVLKSIDREKYIIATKSYSYSDKTAQLSLEKALREINTDYIDIFLLHEQESEHTIRGHYEAIEYFLKAKELGKIKAFGISTHRVEGVIAANKYKEIEIIHPIINKIGLGILDGTIEDMLSAVEIAFKNGKGIYGMKPLAGGHLINQVEEAFNFVKQIPYIHSIAIGMQSCDEVNANINLLEHGYIPDKIKKITESKERRLHIADWCIGCRKCIETCQHGAIEIVDGKAKSVLDRCVLCGYCAAKCPEFCIKVI